MIFIYHNDFNTMSTFRENTSRLEYAPYQQKDANIAKDLNKYDVGVLKNPSEKRKIYNLADSMGL